MDISKINFRLSVVLIILIVIGVYSNSFSGVFLLDDDRHIIENQRIHHLAYPWPFLQGNRRPVLYLTLAVNYAIGQTDPFGYHVFNLIVHIMAGLLLFGIVRQTCLLSTINETLKKESTYLSAIVTLLWLLHPLQTESVTYVIQRAESLMGMFFLLSIYASIRYFLTRNTVWMMTAQLACFFSAFTKEVGIVVPVVILLYDCAFLSPSSRDALKTHWQLYRGFLATWGIMLILILITRQEDIATAGFTYKGISPLKYALTQPEIILHYLKLFFWPQSLVFDYAWLPASSGKEIMFPLLAIIVLILAAFWSFLYIPRIKPDGFLLLSFFIILSPTSSIIPLKDLAFEHRMYLPLACLIVLFVLGWRVSLQKLCPGRTARNILTLCFFSIVISQWGLWTYQRNNDYQSGLRMWQDVIDKRPNNARAHYNLGTYLSEVKKIDAAMFHYQKAIDFYPGFSAAHVNLGTHLFDRTRYEEAQRHFEAAVSIDPTYALAHGKLGIVYAKLGNMEKAKMHFLKGVTLKPEDPFQHYNLAAAYFTLGEYEKAIPHFKQAIAADFEKEMASRLLKTAQMNVKK